MQRSTSGPFEPVRKWPSSLTLSTAGIDISMRCDAPGLRAKSNLHSYCMCISVMNPPGAASASGILLKGLLSILPTFADEGLAVARCMSCRQGSMSSCMAADRPCSWV